MRARKSPGDADIGSARARRNMLRSCRNRYSVESATRRRIAIDVVSSLPAGDGSARRTYRTRNRAGSKARGGTGVRRVMLFRNLCNHYKYQSLLILKLFSSKSPPLAKPETSSSSGNILVEYRGAFGTARSVVKMLSGYAWHRARSPRFSRKIKP